MIDIAKLMADYPRRRPALPEENARVYVEEYKINRAVDARPLYRLTAYLESWMHHQVANSGIGERILEIGAGTLNHCPYERQARTYDIAEPLAALYENSRHLPKINCIYPNIQSVPRQPGYDRIFSIAVLEHLEDLPVTVASCANRLTENGIFQAGIPAEGGLIWGLAWRATTGISYRLRTGLPYGPVMRHEHINSAVEIIAIMRHFFSDVKVRWFPLPARHLAFYGYIEARFPRLTVCEQVAL
jgi:hypothetical protein